MLNDTIKKELLDYAESIEIDVTELDSCVWNNNPYGVESQLIGSSAGYDWDENEEWEAQIKRLVSYIQSDNSVFEYCAITEEEDTQELTHRAINWLNSLLG